MIDSTVSILSNKQIILLCTFIVNIYCKVFCKRMMHSFGTDIQLEIVCRRTVLASIK
jgi:hypothetical protein